MSYFPSCSRSAPPSSTDDSTKGHTAGSIWIDTVAEVAYICVNAAVGAAVWVTLGAAMAMVCVTPILDSVIDVDSASVAVGTLV